MVSLSSFSRYPRKFFLSDLKAGFITSVVALPLAIAFAVASGATPIMGLYTAVVAGILGAIFGGSRFSITGPTGAMTVIILATVNKHGLEGLFLAGLLAGLMQIGFGLLKIGRIVKYIPLPVVTGFTAGIGAIILIGQLPNAFGVSIPPEELLVNTVVDVAAHIGNANPVAITITLFTILSLALIPRLQDKLKFLQNVPPSVVPLALSIAATWFLALNIPQVGEIPTGWPEFKWVHVNFDLLNNVLPAALTIALLGAIEALLCAVVCDSMTSTKHNSDRELIGQGIANVAMPFMSGIPATAAIARSAVSIREGAKSRLAAIIHSVFILIYIFLLAPVVAYVPNAFLAGILMFVSFRMIDIGEFRTISRISRNDMLVLYITFFLTVFTDLVFAVQVGIIIAIGLLFVRLVSNLDVEYVEAHELSDEISALITSHDKIQKSVGVYTIHGPFFFGTMSIFEKKVDEHMHVGKPVTLLRMKYVPFIDSTGLVRLASFIKNKHKRGGYVLMSGVRDNVMATLMADRDFKEAMPREHIFDQSAEAIEYIETNLLAKVEKGTK
jgi:sulfate permease, SulP family